MKRFILSFIFCLVGLVMFAQIDLGTGLRKPSPEPKPNTGLFGLGRRVAIEHLKPAPNGNQIIGISGKDWGAVEFNDAAKILQGNVIDTATGTGLVVVPLDLGTTDYQIFVTPISALGIHSAVSLKTDSAFTVKFWLNDTVANLQPVVFDYLIKKN